MRTADQAWDGIDEAWRESSGRAGRRCAAGTSGSAPARPRSDGEVIYAARNRVSDRDGPHGEVFGSSVAHAEINVLSRLGFRRYRDLVLTTTLQPCLQCAGAIRLARIGTVRYAGHDAYWDGYHDFGRLAEREGAGAGHGADRTP